MKLHTVSFILLVIGGLNWLLIGLGVGWQLSDLFGGMDAPITRIIYVLVGLAAVYEVATHKKNCKHCEGKGGGMA